MVLVLFDYVDGRQIHWLRESQLEHIMNVGGFEAAESRVRVHWWTTRSHVCTQS